MEVGPSKKSLVGQHLFKVRNEPLVVNGIASEPSCEMVVDSTGSHRVQSLSRQCSRADVPGSSGMDEARLHIGRSREFRRCTESGILLVKTLRKIVCQRGQDVIEIQLINRTTRFEGIHEQGLFFNGVREQRCLFFDGLALVRPGVF